jgi:hypothetical protein
MHIILGEQNAQAVGHKYVVLELDTFQPADQDAPMSAFCVIENVPINELAQVDQYRNLHQQLIKNYRAANWKFCEDALEHLIGKWNKELDSFYEDLAQRIKKLQESGVPDNWSGVIDQTKGTA